MKTKTQIANQLKRKTNKELVETIIAAKKNKNWIEVARILSGPRKNRINLNLNEVDKKIKNKETIVVPGKILSLGEITKKGIVVALDFSEKAKEKLLSSKCEISKIIDEIKKNPEAKNVEILKK